MPDPKPPRAAEPPPISPTHRTPRAAPAPAPTPDWRQFIQPATASTRRRFAVCYSGLPGSGKSHAACTWPNAVYFGFDSNQATAAGLLPPERILNLATENGYRWFATSMIHALYHRDLASLVEIVGGPVDTVILDSISFMRPYLEASIPMPITNAGEEDGLAWYRLVKNASNNLLRQLASITSPYPGDPGRPCFHLVCTVHLEERTKKIGKGKDATLVTDRWAPQVEGAFRDSLFAYFDTVILNRDEKVKRRNERGEVEEVEAYVGYTRPPDRYYTAKDGVGGKGKRLAPLPRIVDPTYPGLAKAWGIEESDDGDTRAPE